LRAGESLVRLGVTAPAVVARIFERSSSPLGRSGLQCVRASMAQVLIRITH
jgi:hypothetical protein